MTRRLILLRHAKSSWDNPRLGDHDRILNSRGRAACDAIGPWLNQNGYLPEEVLCSTAARARETWERVGSHVTPTPPVRFFETLYHASPSEMLNALQGARGACIAMVGHNPGIGVLADRLLEEPPGHEGFLRYPTLATLVVDFPTESWANTAPGTGQVVSFIVPRDLTDNAPVSDLGSD